MRDHPAQWRAGSLDRTALYAAAERLAAQRDFPARAQAFARGWLETQATYPALRAVFRNSQRYLLLVASLVLHHRRDPADPLTGITPGRLQQHFDVAVRPRLPISATQVKAIVAHARLNGLLAVAQSPADARVRLLEPTTLLESIFQRWLLGFLQAGDGEASLSLPVAPGVVAAQPGIAGEVFSYRSAALTEDGFILWQDDAQPLAWVLRHDHGYRVFLHMTEAMRPRADGGATVGLNATSLAARAGAARGTVRNLLADARAQGWFADEPSRHGLRLTPHSVRTTLAWIALELVWMHGLALSAWHLRASGPPPQDGGRSAPGVTGAGTVAPAQASES
jgi:hypothetical protein